MHERLTPAQAADADSSALREVELHEGKEGCWARHPKRILDLLDANAALLARAEQAEADRDTLAAELIRIRRDVGASATPNYGEVEDALARAGGVA